MITLNEQGLVSHEPFRQAYDGITFFGCKKSIKNQLSGATGGPVENSKLDKEVVNDFIIPVCKKEDKEKHAGRQFQIRFEETTDGFFIKDLGVGYGVFTETIGPVIIKDNMLVNMGESYIVTNLH